MWLGVFSKPQKKVLQIRYTLYFGGNTPYAFVKTYATKEEAESAKAALKDPKVKVVELSWNEES